MNSETYMQRCLHLAIKGLGNVAPNPMVGCVIVHNDTIIGEGYHQQFGKPHAEVNAINSVAENNRGLLPYSALYVNLEPCAHHGKTPPCADLIIAHKIPKVVIGSFDANPLVAGKGIERMKAAGIEIITGVLKGESDFLNRRFLTYFNQRRPYIILKWAQSQDGFMAPDEPKQLWLTNDESGKLTHQWRSEEQAILAGRKTVEIDNPELTVRLTTGKNPIKISIDRTLKFPRSLKIFKPQSQLILFNEVKDAEEENLKLVKADFSKNLLPQIMGHLFEQKIQSLMVEGGPFTLQQFIAQNLWDEARVFTAPIQLNGGKKSPAIAGEIIWEENIERDRMEIYINPANALTR